jgi:SAM-dependent methyltransferase
MSSEAEIQRDYYTRTADRYDEWHVIADDEHFRALHLMTAFLDMTGARSLLDVGTGTGRALRFMAEHRPAIELRGLEPVPALIEQAVAAGVPADRIDAGTGNAMPYADGSFDAVCELGVLHHVKHPDEVVAEMTRVARRAILLSDNNCFGWGPWPFRLAKNALGAAGLLQPALRLKNRGRDYMLSDDDGLAYTYSVLSALPLLRRWADEIHVIPTVPHRETWTVPRLTASHLLVCALRRA